MHLFLNYYWNERTELRIFQSSVNFWKQFENTLKILSLTHLARHFACQFKWMNKWRMHFHLTIFEILACEIIFFGKKKAAHVGASAWEEQRCSDNNDSRGMAIHHRPNTKNELWWFTPATQTWTKRRIQATYTDYSTGHYIESLPTQHSRLCRVSLTLWKLRR